MKRPKRGMRGMGRIALLALIAVLLVVGVPACAQLFFVVRGKQAERQLARVVAEIAATGAPVKLSQLAGPAIPDAENAAIIYRQAFDALQLRGEELRFLHALSSGAVNLAEPAVRAQARSVVSKNSHALRLIHRASSMPRCDFRFDWSKGLELYVPEFAKLRQCSRLLACESALLVHEGRTDDALAVCGANFRLARAAEAPCMIGVLVEYAISSVACRSLSAALRDAQPSGAACEALARDIARIDPTASLVNALTGYRALGISVFEQTRASGDPLKVVRKVSGQIEPKRRHSTLLRGGAFGRWWLASDELTYLRLMGRIIREARLPWRELVRIHPSVEESFQARCSRSLTPGILTAILLPIIGSAGQARDRAAANLGLAEIALRLKAYRGEHGAYPESLGELPGSRASELPTDPFSGKPFVYRREGAGFLVYSWGANLKDDGGTPGRQREEGDIVVRCER